jgi:hypothetical protein
MPKANSIHDAADDDDDDDDNIFNRKWAVARWQWL